MDLGPDDECQACLKLTLSYWDVAASQTRVLHHTVVIKRERDVVSEPRVEVEVQRQRVLVSQAMASAQRVSACEGRALLADAMSALNASPATRAGSELAEQLRRDVQQVSLQAFRRLIDPSGTSNLPLLVIYESILDRLLLIPQPV